MEAVGGKRCGASLPRLRKRECSSRTLSNLTLHASFAAAVKRGTCARRRHGRAWPRRHSLPVRPRAGCCPRRVDSALPRTPHHPTALLPACTESSETLLLFAAPSTMTTPRPKHTPLINPRAGAVHHRHYHHPRLACPARGRAFERPRRAVTASRPTSAAPTRYHVRWRLSTHARAPGAV